MASLIKSVKKSAGFTLLEVVIYCLIGVLIMLVIAQIFITQTNLGEKQTLQNDIERNATSGIEIIKTNVQSAKTVVTSKTFGSTAYTSDNDTLILELPAVDPSGNLIAGSSDYVVFFRDPLEENLLKMTIEAAAGSARQSNTRIIATFVDSIEFRYNRGNIIDSDAIDAEIRTSVASSSETLKATGGARIKLHNK